MTTVHSLLESNQMSTQLADDLDIPTVTGRPQAQGDLIVVPTKPGKSARPTKPIPDSGVVLVRGNGGHAHVLIGAGTWTPGTADSLDLGVVQVPDGGEAFLIHEEHGALGVGPGCYRVGQQQEVWDEIRRVAD
jgi:hypothetical protein